MTAQQILSLLESRAVFLRNCNDIVPNKTALKSADEIDYLVGLIRGYFDDEEVAGGLRP